MNQDTSNSAGKASWREKLGIAPTGAKDLPKISDEFKGQKPAPKLVAVKDPKPVIKPAPMAPRPGANGANGLRPAQPSPQSSMSQQSLGERLRAEREAAEKLAKQRIAQARGRPVDEKPAESAKAPPVNGQAGGKPKFSFSDAELQQAKREVQSGRDFPGLSQRSAQAQPPPLVPPRTALGGAASMPPPNRSSLFQPRANGVQQPGQPSGYRPLDPPSILTRQREAAPPERQPPMPRAEMPMGYSDNMAPPRAPSREAIESHRRRPPQPAQVYDEDEEYYEDPRRRPAPALRSRRPPAAYDDEMGEVFEDEPPQRTQQQRPRRKASAQDYNQVYREYEGNFDEPRRSRSSGPWLLLSILLAGVLLSGGILYYYLNYMNKPAASGAAQGDVPVIDAPEQPAKAEPLEPDSTDLSSKDSAQPVESRRKQIYDRILGEEEVGGNQMQPTQEQPQIIEPTGNQQLNQPGQDSGSDSLPLPLPPPGEQGSIGTNGSQRFAASNGSQQIPEPASGGGSIPIPEEDQATSLDTAMVPGERHTQEPVQTQEPQAFEADPEPVVKKIEPDKKAKAQTQQARKKAAAKKEQAVAAVENVEQTDYADTDSGGVEPLVLVPPGQPVASNGEALSQAPMSVEQPVAEQPQKSRSFFNFGQPASGTKKLTGKAAERNAVLEPSDTVINTNYANSRQPRASDSTESGEQVASLAPEMNSQPVPEPEIQESAPAQPQQQTSSGGGYVAQLASFRSEAEALAEYDRLRSRHGGLLNGLSPRVTKAVVSGSSRYRLGVGPLASRNDASKLCSNLIAAGERDCLVRSN